MICPGANVRVYLACGATDMRKGIGGLAALVESGLRQKPTSGAVFAFRGRRGDRIKLLTWDGQGFCLYYKILENGRFPWPSVADGTAVDERPACHAVGGHRLAAAVLVIATGEDGLIFTVRCAQNQQDGPAAIKTR